MRLRCISTSLRVAALFAAPLRVVEMAAAAEAKRIAAGNARPSVIAAASAPLKQSPAPTVSTGSTLKAG